MFICFWSPYLLIVAQTPCVDLPAFAVAAIAPVSTIASETKAATQDQRPCCRFCTDKPPLPVMFFALSPLGAWGWFVQL